jgi:hypothetical protein
MERRQHELKDVSYSCVKDEGGPLGIGLQGRVPNHSKLVLEFDIKGLFDNIDHELLLRAVQKHTCNANGRCCTSNGG